MTGIITRIARNGEALFGFIDATTGLEDIFVHRDSVHDSWPEIQKQWIKNKRVPVKFELDNGTRGPRATKVVRISERELHND